MKYGELEWLWLLRDWKNNFEDRERVTKLIKILCSVKWRFPSQIKDLKENCFKNKISVARYFFHRCIKSESSRGDLKSAFHRINQIWYFTGYSKFALWQDVPNKYFIEYIPRDLIGYPKLYFSRNNYIGNIWSQDLSCLRYINVAPHAICPVCISQAIYQITIFHMISHVWHVTGYVKYGIS